MKNVVFFVYFLTILAAASGCAPSFAQPSELQTAMSLPEVSPEPLTVRAHTLDDSNDFVNVTITYPVISGMRDRAAQSAINERVYKDLKGRAQAVETQAREDAKQSGLRVVYSMDAGFSVERNDGRVLSVQIDISTYEGGANMVTDSAFINVINEEEAFEPSFSDLFINGADYKAAINEKIRYQIASNSESDMFDFTTVAPDQWYYLTNTALVVVFPRYAITPGVYGEPEFVIRFDIISDILITSVQE